MRRGAIFYFIFTAIFLPGFVLAAESERATRPEHSDGVAGSPRPIVEEDVSLDEKIGQMLMVGFRGFAIDENSPIAKDIRAGWVGGIILFDRDLVLKSHNRNIRDLPQVKALISKAQSLSQTPLFVAVDQEGGLVRRLKEQHGFPPIPSAAQTAQLPEEKLVALYDLLAKKLREIGINFNLAPSVDVNVNPDSPAIGKLGRSFSSDPEVVIEKATRFVESHRRYGVLTSLKHFPGHGSATDDSHLGFTDITHTWERDKELRPYEELIKRDKTDAVMTAHVFHSRLDDQFPATLSPKIISDLLRKQMGFEGVVFSDDLQMGALSQISVNGKNITLEDTVRLAIEAGVDILLFGNNVTYDENIAEKAFGLIKKLVTEGKLSPDRIERSYRRIKKLKERLSI